MRGNRPGGLGHGLRVGVHRRGWGFGDRHRARAAGSATASERDKRPDDQQDPGHDHQSQRAGQGEESPRGGGGMSWMSIGMDSTPDYRRLVSLLSSRKARWNARRVGDLAIQGLPHFSAR